MTGPGFILPDSGWLPAFGAAASPELVLDTIAAETFEYAKLYENDFVCCQRSQQSWLLLDLVCVKIVDQTDMTRMPALSKQRKLQIRMQIICMISCLYGHR